MTGTRTKYLVAVAFFASAHAAFGQPSEDEKFRRCVEVKDLTLSIAAAADRGVSREELKAQVNNRASVVGLIDLVYDFRGALSNQEMAARQMTNCLKASGFREPK